MKKRILVSLIFVFAAIGLFVWLQGAIFRTLPFGHMEVQAPYFSAGSPAMKLTHEESEKITDNLSKIKNWRHYLGGGNAAHMPVDPCEYAASSHLVVYANDMAPIQRIFFVSALRSDKPNCPEKTFVHWGNSMPSRLSNAPEDALYRAEILKIVESAKVRESEPAK